MLKYEKKIRIGKNYWIGIGWERFYIFDWENYVCYVF